MRTHRFDSYRFLLDHALDWDLLYDLAERIYQDSRLSWRDKDRLFTVLDLRERALGGTAVRRLHSRSPNRALTNVNT